MTKRIFNRKRVAISVRNPRNFNKVLEALLRRIVLVAVALLSFSAANADTITVVGDTVPVRTGPGTGYDVVRVATSGQRVEQVDSVDNWVKVKLLDDTQGWVFRGLTLQTKLPLPTSVSREELDELQGDYWLLVIGIDHYSHWRKLTNAVQDADKVAELLVEQYGFSPERLIKLYNEEATEDNIIQAFLDLKGKLKKNDSLLIYYAGHGVLDSFDVGSWIPVNARVGASADFISTDHINRMLAKLPARHIFLVADACYSGSLFVTRSSKVPTMPTDRFFLKKFKRASRQALTSGGLEEVQDGGGGDGHSIFAFHFIKGLAENDESYMSASALSATVEKRVSRNAIQEPRWEHLKNTGDEAGEFFFIRTNNIDRTTGEITITTLPDAASIWMEGERVGISPVKLNGVSGTITVHAEKAGYRMEQKRISLKAGHPIEINIKLAPLKGEGAIRVRSSPNKAKLYLNGDYKGQTPMDLETTPAGLYQVKLVKNGYETWQASVVVSLTNTTKISASLYPKFASNEADKTIRLSTKELDQVETVLSQFVIAYRNRDLAELTRIATLSKAKQRYLTNVFNANDTLNIAITSQSITHNGAEVVALIDRLYYNLDEPDDRRFKRVRFTVGKENNQWRRIIW